MLSTTSEDKFQNDRRPKKKYQKFKAHQEEDNAVGKISNPVLTNKTTEQGSGFVDLKEFPELKASGSQNRKFFESKNIKFKTDKPWPSVISYGNENKLNETFPALINTGNLKKTSTSSRVKKDNATQAVLENKSVSMGINKVGTEKQISTQFKENKATVKKNSVQPQRNPNKKKRSDPVFLNFEDIFAANKIQRKTDKKQHKILRNRAQRYRNRELLSGNFLDSSNPKRNRGKHREIKKKKLSNLKLSIIKERIIKSKIREQTIAAQFGSSSFNFYGVIDFNKEIQLYLNELNNKKLKKLECKKSKTSENINTEKIDTSKQENVGSKLDKKIENVKSIPDVKEKIIPQITADGEIKFSSKFREYCDNMITPNLNSAVTKLIEELIKLQDRLFSRDPIKAKAKKRHVSGIREVRKYLCLKKVKMIIIAPNLEKLQMQGSVYDSISELKAMADDQNVPYGFALDRFRLGRCTKKNVPVSAFAVMNYEGLEELYDNALHELLEAKRMFSELAKGKVVENTEDVNSKVLSAIASVFQEVLLVSNKVSVDKN